MCTEQRSGLEVIRQGPSRLGSLLDRSLIADATRKQSEGSSVAQVVYGSLLAQTKLGCGAWSVDVMGPSKKPRNVGVAPRVLQLTIRGMLKPKSRHNDYAEYII